LIHEVWVVLGFVENLNFGVHEMETEKCGSEEVASDWTFEISRKIYEGYLLDYCVWLLNPLEGAELYQYYGLGKGILSRSLPVFVESQKNARQNQNKDKNEKQMEDPFSNLSLENKENKGQLNETKKSETEKVDILPTKKLFHRKGARKETEMQSFNEENFISEEPFQLTFEEAFYMMFVMNQLIIYSNQNKERQVLQDECWSIFVERDPRFVYSYAAYHYYRLCGWQPRIGINYSMDYILYQPTTKNHVHAEKGVMFFVLDANGNLDESVTQRECSWRNLGGLERLAESVKKEFVILYMKKEPSFDFEAIKKDPMRLISSLKMMESSISRWIPAKTREKQ
jgi:tRNA splicing endonuclease